MLLLTAVVLIILINAVYQNGSNEKLLPTMQRNAATLSCYLLIPIIALAIYALQWRVQQYGWSVDRIYAAACMIIGATYAIGYSLASFMPNAGLKLFGYWNLGTALLILAIYLALHTPLADPVRLSVANQLHRLKTGQTTPEKFDFDSLKYEGLRYGQQALQDLQNTWQGPQADYVRTKVKATLKLKPGTSHVKQLSVEEKNRLIIAPTQDGKLPESFLKQDWKSTDGSISIPSCLYNGQDKCDAWLIQDTQKKTMIILLGYKFTGFQQNTTGKWAAIGDWYIPSNCREKIQEDAVQGKFKLVVPLVSNHDIEVMGVRISFNQNYDENICAPVNLKKAVEICDNAQPY